MAKISITVSEIDTIVSKLTSSSDTMERTWNSIITEDVEKIRSSWVGADCDTYINRILEMDSEVKNALQALRLLADAYNNAKIQMINVQDSLSNQMKGI